MLISAGLGRKEMWAEVIYTARYVINRLMTRTCKENRILNKVIYIMNPSFSGFCGDGGKAFVQNPVETKNWKCDERSKARVLVGY